MRRAPHDAPTWSEKAISEEMRQPTDRRIFVIAEALRQGWSVERVCKESAYDPWFVTKIQALVTFEARLQKGPLSPGLLREKPSLARAPWQ